MSRRRACADDQRAGTGVANEPGRESHDVTELCKDKPGGAAWIDRMQAGLYRTMCLTSARFDGFFGNARFDDEYQATHGSIAVGTQWDERDHWDPSLRFRVSLRLPQLSDAPPRYVVWGEGTSDEMCLGLVVWSH